MNRNHVALFLAVADAGGFSRAADRLLISQPGISAQVAELEKSLGVTLFERLPRGVRLTEAGEVLAGYARKIATLEADAEQALQELHGLQRGRLHIGASLTIGSYLLPTTLRQFRSRYPQVELAVEIANTQQIQDGVASGKWMLGFTEGLAEHDELHSEVFAKDTMVAIAPPDHPLVNRRNVTAQMVAGEPIILREPGSGSRAVVERALGDKGIVVNAVASLGSAEAIKAAVMCGMGIAFVSALTVVNELKAGILAELRIVDLTIERSLHRVTRRNAIASAAVGEFIRLLDPLDQPKPARKIAAKR